jgi:hypothetical protein
MWRMEMIGRVAPEVHKIAEITILQSARLSAVRSPRESRDIITPASTGLAIGQNDPDL